MKGEPIARVLPTVRSLDRLYCDRSKEHDVGMEWEVRNGLRTGRLTAFCWTCRRQVPVQTQPAPPDTLEFRNRVREAAYWRQKKATRSVGQVAPGAHILPAPQKQVRRA